jgi:photosystem II stability/assembly factor-like uncharacterized protein
MIHYLTVWGSNSNGELNIPERLGQIVGLNSNLISGYRNVSKFYLGARHGIVSKPTNQNYFKPLYSGSTITGYEQIIIPQNNTWGDNTFFQLGINRRIGNVNFYYDKFDLGNDTTYAIDAQLGLIHGFGFDLIFSDLFDATGEIVNWTFADLNLNGIPPGNLALYPRGFKDVKAGDGYVLALNSVNKITGWGDSGNPVISGRRYTGLNALGNIKQITAGQTHALVLFNNGLISGWGDNSLDQLNFDTGVLYSGVKISTKNNHNLALGFAPPTIINITGSGTTGVLNIRNLGYLNKSKNITGLDIQYSLNRKEWTSRLFNTDLNFNQNILFTGTNLLSGNEDYYVRLVEYYESICENAGWEPTLLPNLYSGFNNPTTGNATIYYEGQMSEDGKIRFSITRTGTFNSSISRPTISYDYGKSWVVIPGFTFNENFQSRIAMSKDGNVMSLISGTNRVFISFNSGIDWSGVSSPSLLPGGTYTAIGMSLDGKCHSVFRQFDTVYLSFDSGFSWSGSSQLSGQSLSMGDIALSQDGKNQIMSREASINSVWISSNSGFNWFSTGTPLGSPRGVDISNNGAVQAVITSSQGVYISYNSGTSFNKTINSTLNAGRGISVSPNGKYLCAVGDNTPIALSSDSGNSWDYVPITRAWFSSSISNDGKYVMALTRPGITIQPSSYSLQNCNFGLNPVSGNILNTGSISIYNPFNKQFDIWSDYRVYGWGDSELGIQNIPEKIKNERILDIAAGYNNNLILTENPVAELEIKVDFGELKFLDSNVFVSGGGNFFDRTFLLDGEANGKPLYRYYSGVPARPSNIIIFWDNIQWGLYSGLNNLIYYSQNNVEYPWLGFWEGNNFNYFPVPTILELPSFVEQTPPPCTGFIFDIA